MFIQTSRFGRIKIDESGIIHFVSEILGFPNSRRYVLLRHSPSSPFFWLQSVDEPGVAFVVSSPRLFFPDYRPELPPGVREKLQLEEGEEPDLLVIFRFDSVGKITANLLGPIIINVKKRLALQAVLDPDKYSTEEPMPSIFPNKNSSLSHESDALARSAFCR